MNKKISLILVTYNSEKFIKECIGSIMNQTFKDFKLIIVENNSCDETKKILEACLNELKQTREDIEAEIIYLNNEDSKEGFPIGYAREVALNKVDTEFFTFIDSDDVINKEHLSILFNSINNNNNIVMSVSRFKNFKYEQNKSESVVERFIDNKIKNKNKSISVTKYFKNFFSRDTKYFYTFLWRTLFKTNIVKTYNIHFDKSVKYTEDRLFIFEYLFALTLQKNTLQVALNKSITYLKRSHKNSMMYQRLKTENKFYELSVNEDKVKDIIIAKISANNDNRRLLGCAYYFYLFKIANNYYQAKRLHLNDEKEKYKKEYLFHIRQCFKIKQTPFTIKIKAFVKLFLYPIKKF